MRNLVGGFGWLFGLGVVALVARYGFISSDNPVNGAILAFLFAGLAAGGLFGHAVAVHIWRIHRAWSIVLGLICVAALVLNVSNSLGAIAGRDDKAIAQRSKVQETRADDRAELQRLVEAQGRLPQFVATTQEAVRAARDAVAVAERTRTAECADRGRLCRDREREEAAKRDALERVLVARGLTERAERLEVDMRRLRERLDKGDVIRSTNPQGAIFAKLFRLPDSEADIAATWQQFAMAIVVDLLIMACFIAHEIMGWPKRGEPSAAEAPAAMIDEPIALLPVEQPPAPADATCMARFVLARLPRAKGETVTWGAVYADFARWCGEQQPPVVPFDPAAFGEEFAAICARVNIPTRKRNGQALCVGVKLAA